MPRGRRGAARSSRPRGGAATSSLAPLTAGAARLDRDVRISPAVAGETSAPTPSGRTVIAVSDVEVASHLRGSVSRRSRRETHPTGGAYFFSSDHFFHSFAVAKDLPVSFLSASLAAVARS